jgi:glyoxylase-like metal-dependent hydrolase (beta-lactamase superfamily II)
MRRLLAAVVLLAAIAVVALGGALVWAHLEIRGLDPPLPEPSEIVRFDPGADLPVRLAWINTASQPVPRAGVLEASLDPEPEAPYLLSHPAFVLEWGDGRILLVDLGMRREAALEFGVPAEWLGAEPIRPLGSVGERLGPALERVRAVGFTHLHPDHTEGIASLCARREASLRVVWAPLQATRGNWTTWPGRDHVRSAACAKTSRLEGGPLYDVPGFPGLHVIEAAGHTPGSQIFVAHVRSAQGIQTWVMAGDVANHIEGVRRNIPKPWLYRLMVVPESETRLGRLRTLLAELEREHGARLLLSHDQLSLESSGVPSW